MTSGLKLGVYQLIVDGDFVPASLGRNESNTFNFRLNIIKKLVCQAYSPVGVVSDCAVDDGNFQQAATPFKII
jgi:hypothetical protein